jgi:thymidylate kinase
LENGLPRADIVFVLDVAPQTSFRRKTEKRDVHEGDHQYLKKVRNAYLWLARKDGWKVIDGENYRETVHSEVWALVTRSIRIK